MFLNLCRLSLKLGFEKEITFQVSCSYGPGRYDNQYEVNGKDEFKEHVDVMDYASAKRFLVFFLYLNDNTGGLTDFPEYDTMIKPKAGKLLMFPPLWTHKHIGHKPLEQPKYIVGSYLHYA